MRWQSESLKSRGYGDGKGSREISEARCSLATAECVWSMKCLRDSNYGSLCVASLNASRPAAQLICSAFSPESPPNTTPQRKPKQQPCRTTLATTSTMMPDWGTSWTAGGPLEVWPSLCSSVSNLQVYPQRSSYAQVDHCFASRTT